MVAGGRRAAANLRNTTYARNRSRRERRSICAPVGGGVRFHESVTGGIRYAQTTGYLLGPLRGRDRCAPDPAGIADGSGAWRR